MGGRSAAPARATSRIPLPSSEVARRNTKSSARQTTYKPADFVSVSDSDSAADEEKAEMRQDREETEETEAEGVEHFEDEAEIFHDLLDNQE